ncbi:MAG: hypothetical protein IKS52_00020 [Clostridia bacterium]|nr:hypothetical protein [Clostridia bacterium]MBR4441640.1 hypothetical protein [Clostridia bacterium]
MTAENSSSWDSLSYEEKNRALYERQKRMLEAFLERGAISKAQFEKSLRDLTEKMGIRENGKTRFAEEVQE